MAGAGYKLFTTGSVLTAAEVNTYLNEQTVMVFNDATARTTALSGVLAEGMVTYLKSDDTVYVYNGSAWVSVANTGDITGVTAGTGLSGGGTSGDVTLSLSTPVAATNGGTAQSTYTTGDLLYASGTNTLAKRAIGTTGQVLTVSGGVPTWATAAGGSSMTSLATGTLSGSAFSAAITSISTAYTHLQLWITDMYATGANIVQIRFNSNSGAVYAQQLVLAAQSPTVVGSNGNDRISTYNGAITSANQNGWILIDLPFYSTTASAKPFKMLWNRTGGSGAIEQLWGSFDSTSAITSISFSLDGGTSYSGGDYTLYGVK